MALRDGQDARACVCFCVCVDVRARVCVCWMNGEYICVFCHFNPAVTRQTQQLVVLEQVVLPNVQMQNTKFFNVSVKEHTGYPT